MPRPPSQGRDAAIKRYITGDITAENVDGGSAALLTTLIRSERFRDGTLESAFKRGLLTAIVRRATVLAGD